MIREVTQWLGPPRARLLAALLAILVLAALVVQVSFGGEAWAASVQVVLLWIFLAAAALAIHSRLPRDERARLWTVVGPGLLLLAIGVVLPGQLLFFGGAALGWIVVVQFVLRSRVRMEYQAAIKHLRHNEIAQAVAVMDDLIRGEPGDPSHYRFRAELHRLAGHLPQAISDYETMIRLNPAQAAGYTGLAEVYAQRGDYDRARAYGLEALERDPQQWMAAYNLGMIEDRRGDSESALKALRQADALGIPHSRYRLLAALWRARAEVRLGRLEEAQRELDRMRAQADGLKDWELVFASDQAAVLRSFLSADVDLARQLVSGEAALNRLGEP